MKTTSRTGYLGAALAAGWLSVACGGGTEPAGGTAAQALDPATGLPLCATNPDERGPGPCIDESGARLCKVDSGLAGDELALCEPDPDLGMLIHYGPTNYDDPEDIANFTLEAGGEDETCTFVHSPNTETRHVKNYHGRLRPHSHHLIVTTLEEDTQDTHVPVACLPTDAVGSRWLVGSQSPIMDVAVSGAVSGDPPQPGDPDYHLGQRMLANTAMRMDLHYVNTTDEALLKEAWVGFDWAKESEVDKLVDMITFFQGDIDIPPGGTQETKLAKCTAPTDRNVALLTAHFHKSGTRFSVWHERADSTRELVYETYDWAEPGNLWYRDGFAIPPANEATNTTGGNHEGYLHVKAGESLIFQCAFKNKTAERLTLGETSNDEMCNTFGMYYPSNGDVWGCACMGENCFAPANN